jgi:peptidoglycan/xylan/chitin deacetylase (PgdA/CDA1 family)
MVILPLSTRVDFDMPLKESIMGAMFYRLWERAQQCAAALSRVRAVRLGQITRLVAWGSVAITVVSGCALPSNQPPGPTMQPTYTLTLDSPLLPTTTPTLVDTISPSDTPAPPEPSPTPELVWNPPGEVTAPILLYHHIEDTETPTRFSVSVANFEEQMRKLKEWGYTSISVELLVQALTEGAYLPPRPVVITFDDGQLSVYENAFPIMAELGLQGTLYIVANRLDGPPGFMDRDQISEMLAAGWEIGSHGMSHIDLTQVHDQARRELLTSRLDLESAFGVKVATFAYPFGLIDDFIAAKTVDYGYRAGVGLGKLWVHTLGSLYYLSRIEIHGTHDISTFGNMLPWNSPPQ